jgi:hypothetical protein
VGKDCGKSPPLMHDETQGKRGICRLWNGKQKGCKINLTKEATGLRHLRFGTTWWAWSRWRRRVEGGGWKRLDLGGRDVVNIVYYSSVHDGKENHVKDVVKNSIIFSVVLRKKTRIA